MAKVASCANVRRSIVVFDTDLPSRITNTREAAIGTSPFGPPKVMLTGTAYPIMLVGDPSGKKICTPDVGGVTPDPIITSNRGLGVGRGLEVPEAVADGDGQGVHPDLSGREASRASMRVRGPGTKSPE